jgi:uncharacterized metal-binding protein YceD (DUF177 family)
MMDEVPPLSWRVPASQLAEEGQPIRFEAGPEERARLARYAGILAVDSLTVEGEVQPWAGGVEIDLRLQASVVQACVVSLAPVPQTIDEPIVRRFLPPARLADGPAGPVEINIEAEDPPELLASDTVDLGPVITEHLVLALEPYPRAPGAALPTESAGAAPEPSPFAVLKRLKDPG